MDLVQYIFQGALVVRDRQLFGFFFILLSFLRALCKQNCYLLMDKQVSHLCLKCKNDSLCKNCCGFAVSLLLFITKFMFSIKCDETMNSISDNDTPLWYIQKICLFYSVFLQCFCIITCKSRNPKANRRVRQP